MIEWEVAGHTVEYDDYRHLYIVDGIIKPSVTQVMKAEFGNKYDGIPKFVLNKAAKLGTMLHEAIEKAEISGVYATDNTEISQELRNYSFLKKSYGWKVAEVEKPLLIPYEGEIICAGRCDQLIEIDGKVGVADIKRTSTLDKNYLSYQLTLYKRGWEYSYGITPEVGYVIHLRKDVRKFIEIPFCESLVDNLLKGEWDANNSKIEIPIDV